MPTVASGKSRAAFMARNKEFKAPARERINDYISRWAVQIPPSPVKEDTRRYLLFLCLYLNFYIWSYPFSLYLSAPYGGLFFCPQFNPLGTFIRKVLFSPWTDRKPEFESLQLNIQIYANTHIWIYVCG